jgi:hypothetical protein
VSDAVAACDCVEPDGIALLRAIVQLLAERQDGGGVPGQNFAAAVAAYENGAAAGIELGECFGLKPSAGSAGWWTCEIRARRAAKILEIDRLMFAAAPRPKVHPRATSIGKALRRYASDAWPRERLLPIAPADPLRRLMWQLLKLGDAPSISTIQRRLAGAGADFPIATPIDGKN